MDDAAFNKATVTFALLPERFEATVRIDTGQGEDTVSNFVGFQRDFSEPAGRGRFLSLLLALAERNLRPDEAGVLETIEQSVNVSRAPGPEDTTDQTAAPIQRQAAGIATNSEVFNTGNALAIALWGFVEKYRTVGNDEGNGPSAWCNYCVAPWPEPFGPVTHWSECVEGLQEACDALAEAHRVAKWPAGDFTTPLDKQAHLRGWRK